MRIEPLAWQLSRLVMRPGVWPSLLRWLGSRLRVRLTGVDRAAEDVREAKAAGSAWCASVACDPAEGLSRLGLNAELVALTARFPEEIAAAAARVATVPFRLGGASNIDLIYAICEALNATRAVETGVANGWSSLAILLSMSKRPGAALHSVDMPYLKYQNDPWVGIAVPERLRACWTLHRCPDREGLPKALEAVGEIDFAHYDSDKSEAGRLFAYPLLWEALRPGGVLFSDDIHDNLGFRRFCDRIARTPIIVRQGDKFQGILRRP